MIAFPTFGGWNEKFVISLRLSRIISASIKPGCTMLKLVLLFGLAACAYSAPLLITSGDIHVSSTTPVGTFALAGSDFSATGSFRSRESAWLNVYCSQGGCPESVIIPGRTIGVGASDFILGGTAALDGTTFSPIVWGNEGVAHPSGLQITDPDIPLNGPGTYVFPFSFTGSLCATINDFGPPIVPCLADLSQLTGSGLLTLIVGPDTYDTSRIIVLDETYTFTPEPASIVLVGTALILFAIRKYKWHRPGSSAGSELFLAFDRVGPRLK